MKKDLVILVADIQQEKTIEALLIYRQASLNIRTVSFDIYRHPSKDPGVYHDAANFLAAFVPQYEYALVVLDREWGGSPNNATEMQQHLHTQLYSKGWSTTNCEVIVIDPELEAWIWSTSPHVATILRTKSDKIKKAGSKARLLDQRRSKTNPPQRTATRHSQTATSSLFIFSFPTIGT